jgi:hypothetical protein
MRAQTHRDTGSLPGDDNWLNAADFHYSERSFAIGSCLALISSTPTVFNYRFSSHVRWVRD